MKKIQRQLLLVGACGLLVGTVQASSDTREKVRLDHDAKEAAAENETRVRAREMAIAMQNAAWQKAVRDEAKNSQEISDSIAKARQGGSSLLLEAAVDAKAQESAGRDELAKRAAERAARAAAREGLAKEQRSMECSEAQSAPEKASELVRLRPAATRPVCASAPAKESEPPFVKIAREKKERAAAAQLQQDLSRLADRLATMPQEKAEEVVENALVAASCSGSGVVEAVEAPGNDGMGAPAEAPVSSLPVSADPMPVAASTDASVSATAPTAAPTAPAAADAGWFAWGVQGVASVLPSSLNPWSK